MHLAAPAAQQRLHAVEDRRLVVDAERGDAGELAGIDSGVVARAAVSAGAALRARHVDRRNASRCRLADSTLDLVAEHARDALDDRQAEAEAARDPRALIEPVEFEEDVALLRLRNADAGVVDVDAQLARAGAGSRPARGPAGVYLMAFDTRFCSSRRSSRRSERTASEHGTKVSSSPLARASGANSTSIWRINSSMRKLANSGRIAPVSSREMSSSAPKISSTASSEASILSTSWRVARRRLALDQAGDVEPRGVERLQDVVAGGGEELASWRYWRRRPRLWRAPARR